MVNIDTVYQKVLATANKEQRGYITPQEFNLFADQAQMEIFEQYFYDINQFRRVPGNNHVYSDMVTNLEEKISIFKERNFRSTSAGNFGAITLPSDIYRLGTVRGINNKVAEELKDGAELILYENSPLARMTLDRPVFIRETDNKIRFYPYDAVPMGSDGVINYIKKPIKPNWSYVVVNGYAQFNGGPSEDFELHPSEENNLVLKILQLSGIVMKDVGLYQVAAQEEMKDIQQEKQ